MSGIGLDLALRLMIKLSVCVNWSLKANQCQQSKHLTVVDTALLTHFLEIEVYLGYLHGFEKMMQMHNLHVCEKNDAIYW